SSLLAIFITWAISGCVRDEFDGPVPPEGETAEVNISVAVPGIPPANGSRALNPAGESAVNDIIVLVFEGDNYKYRADGHTIVSTSDENIKNFNVTLQTGTCDLWILANCKSVIDAYTIPPNATKATFRNNLLLDVAGKWNTASTGFTPLPMWGEKTGVNVTPHLTLKGNDRVTLLRAVAKVDVTIDRGAVPEADFTLNGVSLYHWSNRGQLIPDASAFGSDPTMVQRISGNTRLTDAG
ncbi:MAG: fimbrial protein, partial [Rikenellaceae bacterium]|nr:fimbrial protein [Rikenellaceae bacterium]